jgi:hypothetical protein
MDWLPRSNTEKCFSKVLVTAFTVTYLFPVMLLTLYFNVQNSPAKQRSTRQATDLQSLSYETVFRYPTIQLKVTWFHCYCFIHMQWGQQLGRRQWFFVMSQLCLH